MKISRVILPALFSLALGSVALGNTVADSELAALIAKAEKGNAIAQYNLGLSYAEGRGTPADPIEAFVWLTFAQENGARGRALEILMTRLSPAQLEIARARLDKRRAVLGFTATTRETPASASASPSETTPADTPALEVAARELAQARLDKQQLSNELAAAWKEADQLKSEHAAAVERAATERAGLERMLTQAQQAALDLGQQVDALKARLAELAARPGAPAYPDLRERVADLEAQVAALRDAPPAFPDQRARVSELEQQLAAATARPSAPAYPDLRSRVSELENQLRSARESGSALEARADALAKARAGVESELQTLRTQLTRSQQQAGNAEDEVRRFRARVAELESAVADRPSAQPAAPAYPDLRERVADLESQLAALRNAPPAYPDLRARVGELEQQLAAVSARTAQPSYPDLRNRVAALESELAAARTAAPAYPDLRERVTELEHQLAVTQGPAPGGDTDELTRELEATRNRLTTALRGYTLLQQEHQELRARVDGDRATLIAERDNLAARLAIAEATARSAQDDVARLTESLAALQRSTSTAAGDLTSARALVQQLQGANAVLARENYELKARVARDPSPGAPAAPAAGRTHTVADGDSLSRLSQRYYGTPARWQEIFNANRDVLDAQGTLRVGMVLRVP